MSAIASSLGTLLFSVSLWSLPADELAVLGGELSENGVWPAVVAIGANNRICTGVLLSPTVVATAAHCLAPLSKNDTPTVYLGQNLDSELRSIHYVKEWATHPEYCSSKECSIPKYDFGYLVLDAAITSDNKIEYAQLLTEASEWKTAMYEGGDTWLVGFGEDEAGEIGQKRHVRTSIAKVMGEGAGFMAGGDGKDSCVGDSGGPAYVRVGEKEWRVAGFLSAGSSPCGSGGYYASAIDAAAWLTKEAQVDKKLRCEDAQCLQAEAQGLDTKGGCSLGEERPWWTLVLGLLPALLRPARRPGE